MNTNSNHPEDPVNPSGRQVDARLNDLDLSPEERATAVSLLQAAETIQASPAFKARLQSELQHRYEGIFPPSSKARQTRFPQERISTAHLAWHSLGWIVAVLLLVALMSWATSQLLPHTAAQPTSSVTPQPHATTSLPGVFGSVTPMAPTQPPNATPMQTAAPAFTSPLFPGARFYMMVPLPRDTPPVQLYNQADPAPLTIAGAQAKAAQLGIQGTVYQNSGEGANSLMVSDGRSWVVFLSSTERFSYVADLGTILDQHGTLPPYDQQVSVAVSFLQEHGLLNFDYQAEPLNNNLGTLSILPKIDGRRLSFGSFESPGYAVTIDAQGRVLEVNSTPWQAQPVESLPLISAYDAWQRVVAGETGIRSAILEDQPHTLQSWQRPLPENQAIDLYGYLSVMQPALPGEVPLVSINNANLRLSGDLGTLLQTDRRGELLRLHGRLEPAAAGGRVFQLESWQSAGLEELNLTGLIERSGDQVLLHTGEHTYTLPAAPAGLPDGAQVMVRAVQPDPASDNLDWSMIQSGEPGPVGLEITNTFRQLNPAGSATPVPSPTPALDPAYQPGAQAEDLQVTVWANAEGTYLATAGDPQSWIWVDQPVPPELLAFNQLPVRVWGTYSLPHAGQPSLQVVRVEAVYPGLHYQAWLGTYEMVSLEGASVVRFSDQDGQQYILMHDTSPVSEEIAGRPGDRIIVEGLAIPGETYGGYPTIQVSAASMAGERTNLDGYTIQSGQLPMSTPEGNGGQPGQPQTPTGAAQVEAVELAYVMEDLKFGPLPPGQPAYLQPAWRFSGHFASGQAFEILVQALPESYYR